MNISSVKNFIFLFLVGSHILVFGQSAQSEYLEAKRQFNLSNYTSAKQSFKSIIDDRTFGPYASFYYGLSALREGNETEAYDMWKQTLVKFPEWEKKEEVNYWLGYTAFSLGKYWEGFNHIESLPEEVKLGLVENEFSDYSLADLERVHALNPKNPFIASYLVDTMMRQPYSKRDHTLLATLSEDFGLAVLDVDEDIKLMKKDTYAIAAVLPFMFDGLTKPQSVIRNSIILDLYTGMLMAQEDLNRLGINIEISPYDTKKSKEIVKQLASSGQLENADLIVGPLYGGPYEVINEYSKEQKISMINPLSSNGDLIGDNPFSFLFKPSYETQGRIAAEYARKAFSKNRLAYILYETDRDSLVASAYKEELERDSFLVVRYERMTNESAQEIQKDFTEKYELRLDTMYSAEQMDSINLIPGRYVKERPLRDEESGEIIKDANGDDVLESYEELFYVQPDSIGHMFVASGSNLLANNFIRLAEVRTDTIGIIGYENWLDFTTLSFDQLERLGITFISPSLFKKSESWYKAFKDDFIAKHSKEPSDYHLLGYELVYQLGKLLQDNGKYFQIGLRSGEYFEGKVMSGLQYGTFNDNQVVPITKLEDLLLVDQNAKEEE